MANWAVGRLKSKFYKRLQYSYLCFMHEMNSATLTEQVEQRELLLEAQAHIWSNILCFIKSMALKSAIQLGIPDTIHKHGSPITLPDLAISLSIHPTKVSSLGRLMRLLVSSKFFSKETQSNGNETYSLTLSSELLLKDHPLSQAPFALASLDPIFIESSHHLSSWFLCDTESTFHIVNGKSAWEHASCEPEFNKFFNQAMESDSRFVTSLLISSIGFKGLVDGVESLVDVGGGNGTTAKAIAEAYPRLECIVLDLPHVVEGLEENGSNLVYVAGDMFEAIPRADTVLLKWILHDWSDHDCIRILQRCKEAIPSKHEGGKVIIIDIVVEPQNDNISDRTNAQLQFDMVMMSFTKGGKERTKQEWEKLFIAAGFSDYKILSILGLRSLIVLYP